MAWRSLRPKQPVVVSVSRLAHGKCPGNQRCFRLLGPEHANGNIVKATTTPSDTVTDLALCRKDSQRVSLDSRTGLDFTCNMDPTLAARFARQKDERLRRSPEQQDTRELIL